MTNKKFKNMQENLWARDLLFASSRNILIGYACLEDMGVKSDIIRSMDKEYNKVVRKGERDDNDGVAYEMSERMVADLGLEIKDFTNLVNTLNKEVIQCSPMSSRSKVVWFITYNLILFFSHINCTLGYGAIRLERLMNRMKSYRGDPDKDGERILNCKFEDKEAIPDVSSIGYKEPTIKVEDLDRLKTEMCALRMLQTAKGALI